MWLPGPIYEGLPYAYWAGGLLFISGTIYADPPQPMFAVYLSLGRHQPAGRRFRIPAPPQIQDAIKPAKLTLLRYPCRLPAAPDS